MTCKDYLQSLRETLGFLEPGALATALSFYHEMLEDRMEDGMNEEEAVASMETPEAIAAQLRTEEKASRQNRDPREAWEEHLQAQSNSTEGWEKKTAVFPAAEIRDVSLRCSNMAIRIHAAEDHQATLTYYTSKDDVYTADLQNGVLSLDHVNSGRKYGTGERMIFVNGVSLFQFLRGDIVPSPAVELALPAATLTDLHIKTSNGSIRIEELQALCKVNLATSNGKLICTNLQCQSLEGTTTNGKMTLNNIHCRQNICCTTSNSGIAAEQITAGDELSLTTSNGPVKAEAVKASMKVQLKTRNGYVHAQDITAGATILLRSSNGSLRVQAVEAPQLTLQTTNGSIQGTLPGRQADWSIDSHTSSYCRNSLPEHASGPSNRILSASTSNASINLQFAE